MSLLLQLNTSSSLEKQRATGVFQGRLIKVIRELDQVGSGFYFLLKFNREQPIQANGFISAIVLYTSLSRDLTKMSKWRYYLVNKQLSVVLILIFAEVWLGGCAAHSQLKSKSFVPKQAIRPKSVDVERVAGIEAAPIPEKLPCHRQYQDEIIALKQALAEKDELIRNLSVRELDQTQVLQETASEIGRAKNKLHRLATQPEAASKIAEVEVAMTVFKQTELRGSADTVFQFLARGLLNAAMAAYEQKDYSGAMNYAAQSSELIDVVTNPARKKLESQDVVSSFRIPILLLVTRTGNLQVDPDSNSTVISLLKKNTPLTASAYYGNWFRVQTADNLSGWIQNQTVDIQINDPSFGK